MRLLTVTHLASMAAAAVLHSRAEVQSLHQPSDEVSPQRTSGAQVFPESLSRGTDPVYNQGDDDYDHFDDNAVVKRDQPKHKLASKPAPILRGKDGKPLRGIPLKKLADHRHTTHKPASKMRNKRGYPHTAAPLAHDRATFDPKLNDWVNWKLTSKSRWSVKTEDLPTDSKRSVPDHETLSSGIKENKGDQPERRGLPVLDGAGGGSVRNGEETQEPAQQLVDRNTVAKPKIVSPVNKLSNKQGNNKPAWSNDIRPLLLDGSIRGLVKSNF